MHASRSLVLTCGLALLAAACSSPVQIQTSRPISSLPSDTTEAVSQAQLALALEIGTTALPADVQAMRFRIDEVHLKPTDGDWITFPADANAFEITAARPTQKPILTTRVPPATYDSLAISLDDVFVLYDANAGGPLTHPGNRPVRLRAPFEARPDHRTTLRLVFEPGASLSRDKACRWFLLPFFEVVAD